MRKNYLIVFSLLFFFFLGISVYKQPYRVKLFKLKEKAFCVKEDLNKYEFFDEDYHFLFCYKNNWEVTGITDRHGRPDIYIRSPHEDLVIRLELIPQSLAEVKNSTTRTDVYLSEKRNKILKLIDNDKEVLLVERSTPAEWWVPSIYINWYRSSINYSKKTFFASTIFDEDNTDPFDVLELSSGFSILRETFVEFP